MEDEHEPVRAGDETRCNRCSFRGPLVPGHFDCPDCGAPLLRRVSPPVGPASHAGALFAAVFSLRGVLFAGTYAALIFAPLPFTNLIAYALLCGAAIQVAWKAMLARRYRLDFPEIGANLLELRWVFPVALLLGGFVLLPAFLLGLGAGTGVGWFGALAFALFAWAPVGLLGYLRHGNVLGFLWPDTALTLVQRDPLGLLGLSLSFLAVLYGGVSLDAWLSTSLLGSLAGSAVWAFALLYAFGIAGLYLRKHSRALDLDLDGDEWAPLRVVNLPGAAPRAAPAIPHHHPLHTYPEIPYPGAQAQAPIVRVAPARRGLQTLPYRPREEIVVGQLLNDETRDRRG